MTTICRQCDHFIENGPIWYSQFCGAVKNIEAVNPVTGEPAFAQRNSLGDMCYSDQQFAYAGDINKGDCEYFQTSVNRDDANDL